MTQRTIEIRSEAMLERPIACYPSDKILWINIRSPLAAHPIKLCRPLEELPPEWCLSLRFDDIRVNVPADKAWTLFDMAMACKIVGFVDQDWDILLINCEAGVSRSAAVALAISEHLGLPSPLIDRLHSPNPVVLEILRTAFSAGKALPTPGQPLEPTPSSTTERRQAVMRDRYAAGETIESLAYDYRLSDREVEVILGLL